MSDPVARDFIYLDTERVRSVFAQVEQGLVETTAAEHSSEQSASGGVSAGIPFIGAGTAKADILWAKKATETRTLHDHIYNRVEQRLAQALLMVDLTTGALPVGWKRTELEHILTPVSFVKCKGRVRLNDYRQMLALLRGMHDFADVIASFAILDQTKGRAKGTVKTMKEEFIQKMELPPKKLLQDMANIIERFYGDSVVLKILPDEASGDCAFVCRLNKEFLRDSIEDISFKFGPSPEHPWTVTGTVARMPPEGAAAGAPIMPEVENGLEKAVEPMFDASRELFSVGMVRYPFISLTPLAVYRE